MKQKLHLRFAAFLICLQLVLSGCAKEKTNDELSLTEMKVKATAHLKKQEFEQAAEHLQLMITKFPEDPKIGNYKISLANCKFNNTEYEAAYQLYENFHQYYPSDKRAEYAKYKAALCKFRQSLDFDRDQTATNAALNACKAYQEIATYQKYRTEIATTHEKCLQKLIDKELSICKFYIKHGKTQAATKRLEQARKMFGLHKDLEANLLYLECKLANKTDDQLALEEKINALTTNFATSPYTKMAENLVKKPVNFVF